MTSIQTQPQSQQPLLVASREDIATQLKHLSPSAKEWVSLVTRQAVKNKETPGSAKQQQHQHQQKNAKSSKAGTGVTTTPTPKEDLEDSDNGDNDNDSQLDDFDDLVKFVFDSSATNPWDERLYKWVMQAFDRNSAFLTDDDAVPLGEAAVKSLVAADPTMAPLITTLSLESGGRIALPLPNKDALKKAAKTAAAASLLPPKITEKQLQLELASICAAIEKEKERISLKIKDLCDPYLNKAIKSMNALYDFDDAISDNFLNGHVRKMLKKKLDLSRNPPVSFDDYWSDATRPFSGGSTAKSSSNSKDSKKKSGTVSSSSTIVAVDQNDVRQIDVLWEKYLENVTAAADLCIDFISNETIAQIVLAAEQLQSNLVLSLNEMVQQSSSTPITPDTQEIIDGTKMNLVHFKEFLQSESSLHKQTHVESRTALNDIIQELDTLYKTTPATVTPTIRGRLERTRSKDFVKKIKQLDQEFSQFRTSLLTNLEEFAENIQWDGLVLGVEVVGACLDICDGDLEAAHEPIRKEWEANVSSGLLYDKLELMNSLYREGVRFGLYEYVKAVGKPLLEALNRVPASVLTAASSTTVSAATTAVTAASATVASSSPASKKATAPAATAATAPVPVVSSESVKKQTAPATPATAAVLAAAATTSATKKKSKKGKKKGGKESVEHEDEVEEAPAVPVAVAADPAPTPAKKNAVSVAPEEGMEVDSAEDDDELDLDAAIPPQYVQKSSNESLATPIAEVPRAKPPAATSPVVFAAKPTIPVVPVWPRKPTIVAAVAPQPSAPAAAPAEPVGGFSAPGLGLATQQPLVQQQQLPQHLPQQQQQQQLPIPTAEEFHSLRMAYSRAMHEINKLHNDNGLFLQEIHRLNSELSHWKAIALSQAQAPGLVQQQQQQQFFQSGAPPGFGGAGGPPGIVVGGGGSGSGTGGSNTPSSSSLLGGQGSGGDLFLGSLNSQLKTESNTQQQGQQQQQQGAKASRAKSPVSWRRGGQIDGFGQQAQQAGGANRNSNARGGGSGMGAIGGEKRIARPPGLLSSPKDPNSVRRAFLRGVRDLRCGNCGEAGHESNSCTAACRYCDEKGHLAAQCPY
ncbi:UNVERIFIED_CONTAM: hypothetical protein HDU68_010364 [Siphonaria sp. JEL0065]|nr:hypothetical protein HDU68_010364 [Siphonaria sp. JEL0065]